MKFVMYRRWRGKHEGVRFEIAEYDGKVVCVVLRLECGCMVIEWVYEQQVEVVVFACFDHSEVVEAHEREFATLTEVWQLILDQIKLEKEVKKTMLHLAAVCQRAGVKRSVAHKALLEALKKGAPLGQPKWAMEVVVDNQHYVVGQGRDPRFFLVFPLPFKGHADEWKVVPPFNTAEEFLALL